MSKHCSFWNLKNIPHTKFLSMLEAEREKWIKILKKDEIQFPLEDTFTLSYGVYEVNRILPHRTPLALVHHISKLNLRLQQIQIENTIDPQDPVFSGHFPNHPVYPGIYQIEMMGQAGLCLLYFLQNETVEINPVHKPILGLFTRVHNASFLKPVLPGDKVTVIAKMIEYDEYLGIMAVQLFNSGVICSHAILEAYLP